MRRLDAPAASELFEDRDQAHAGRVSRAGAVVDQLPDTISLAAEY